LGLFIGRGVVAGWKAQQCGIVGVGNARAESVMFVQSVLRPSGRKYIYIYYIATHAMEPENVFFFFS